MYVYIRIYLKTSNVIYHITITNQTTSLIRPGRSILHGCFLNNHKQHSSYFWSRKFFWQSLEATSFPSNSYFIHISSPLLFWLALPVIRTYCHLFAQIKYYLPRFSFYFIFIIVHYFYCKSLDLQPSVGCQLYKWLLSFTLYFCAIVLYSSKTFCWLIHECL